MYYTEKKQKALENMNTYEKSKKRIMKTKHFKSQKYNLFLDLFSLLICFEHFFY